MQLRWYQKKAIEETYKAIKAGSKKVLVHLSTGGGKSLILKKLVEDAIAKNRPVVFVVRRRNLVNQFSEKHLQGIDHSIYMAGKKYIEKNIVVCSVDTIISREYYPHEGKAILIVDESHDAITDSYQQVFSMYEYVIGVTATPYNGIGDFFDSVVMPVKMSQLRDEGFLTPCKILVPNVIDTNGISVNSGGDFNNKELTDRCSQTFVLDTIVEDFLRYAKNRKTILFATSIEHSKKLVDKFLSNGINAIHIDSEMTKAEVDNCMMQFKNGTMQVLSNVNLVSTGFDLPEIDCIQFARPTKSLIFWLQAVGRGLRPCDGKTECLILDNAGNALRFGSPFRHVTACGSVEDKSDNPEDDLQIRRCEKCFMVYELPAECCPSCGHINKKSMRKLRTISGELVEFNMTDEEIEMLNRREFQKSFYVFKNVVRKQPIGKQYYMLWGMMKKRFGQDSLDRWGPELGYKTT